VKRAFQIFRPISHDRFLKKVSSTIGGSGNIGTTFVVIRWTGRVKCLDNKFEMHWKWRSRLLQNTVGERWLEPWLWSR